MRTMVKRLAILGTVLTLICVGFALFAHRSAKTGPRFYREALQIDRQKYEQAGEQFEMRLADLHNDVRREGAWEAVFTESQINGWLATDLPDKFPRALPDTVTDPRVALVADQVHVGFQFANERFEGVVSFQAEMYLTDEPNVLAIKISHLRAGIIPLPIDRWTLTISSAAARTGLKVRWSQDDGLPLALVTVPARVDEYAEREISMAQFAIRDGKVTVGGTTQPIDKEAVRTAQSDDQSGTQVSSQR